VGYCVKYSVDAYQELESEFHLDVPEMEEEDPLDYSYEVYEDEVLAKAERPGREEQEDVGEADSDKDKLGVEKATNA